MTPLVFFLLLVGSASTLRAATVVWDRGPESDIAGYIVSYGTQSHTYTTTMDVGNVTSSQLTVAGGKRYYVAVQTYNTAGLVSVFSAEVVYDAPASTTAPSVTSLTPATGPIGTLVTIAGANFGSAPGSVTFNGKTATPTDWSSTRIVAAVPAGATSGNVVVTAGGASSAGVAFSVSAASGPGQISSPAPGSTLTASTVTFQWTGGTGVTDFWLYVGTAAGASDLASVGSGGSLNATVGGLPTDGRRLYVRLWSLINGTWLYNDYTYAAPTQGTSTVRAELTTPAPGSTLTASAVTFQWTGGTGVTQYRLTAGSTSGGTDLFNPAAGTSLTASVTGLPTDGRTVYVRLGSLINGAWVYNDYTYTATTQGTSAIRAELTTPAPGSTLTASTVTFQWTGGTGVSQTRLTVGTASGGSDLFNQAAGTILNATVSGLPADGRTLYVRLWSLISGTWSSNDYTYTARATTATGPGQITSPAPGSTLTSSTASFQWTGGTGVTDFWLYVGTAAGASDLSSQGSGINLGATVTGLPTDGRVIYVRLWSDVYGIWQYHDYTFTAPTQGGTAARAELTTPAPGSTLTASAVTFQWTGGTGVAQYRLTVGTAAGATDIFNQAAGTGLTATVAGLPTDGRTLYVRLGSLINGVWVYNDYTVTAGTATTGGPGQLTSPAPGSTLTASTVTLQWTGGTGVTDFWLYVGTTVGGSELSSQGPGLRLSATVTGLPTDGRKVYVRLFSQVNGAWLSRDYVYTASSR